MKKKILLAVLIIVILLGAGFAYAYFAKDSFKTEKEMFFSYILKNDILEKLQDKKLTEYLQKQQNTAYTNKGEITLGYTGDETSTDDESLAMLDNSKITFEGKTDANKKLAEQTLSVNFAQAFTVPVNFKLDGNTVGIQSGFLNSKYIAVRNENLKELFKKFGIENEEIPDKIEFTEQNLTDEQLKTVKNSYLSILNENLEDELFSKEETKTQTVLKLKMTEQKVIDVLIKLLEKARNDETLLAGAYNKTELQTQIDEAISELKEVETSETNTLEIKLYVENKKIVKIEISALEDNEVIVNAVMENQESQMAIKLYEENALIGELIISKEENEPTYLVSLKMYDDVEGDIEITFKIQYKNLETLDNVEEKYEIKITIDEPDEAEEQITVNFKNLIAFDNNLQIDKLNENNAIVLNDATEQELQNLILTIYQNLGLMQ